MIYGTTNLTIKSDNDRMLVWATDVNTGLPVANAILKVYGNSAQEVGSGITDAQGLADNTCTTSPRLLVAFGGGSKRCQRNDARCFCYRLDEWN
jgi:uncharacterized protein YfaS (alpha-2-macroglobulin family)